MANKRAYSEGCMYFKFRPIVCYHMPVPRGSLLYLLWFDHRVSIGCFQVSTTVATKSTCCFDAPPLSIRVKLITKSSPNYYHPRRLVCVQHARRMRQVKPISAVTTDVKPSKQGSITQRGLSNFSISSRGLSVTCKSSPYLTNQSKSCPYRENAAKSSKELALRPCCDVCHVHFEWMWLRVDSAYLVGNGSDVQYDEFWPAELGGPKAVINSPQLQPFVPVHKGIVRPFALFLCREQGLASPSCIGKFGGYMIHSARLPLIFQELFQICFVRSSATRRTGLVQKVLNMHWWICERLALFTYDSKQTSLNCPYLTLAQRMSKAVKLTYELYCYPSLVSLGNDRGSVQLHNTEECSWCATTDPRLSRSSFLRRQPCLIGLKNGSILSRWRKSTSQTTPSASMADFLPIYRNTFALSTLTAGVPTQTGLRTSSCPIHLPCTISTSTRFDFTSSVSRSG